MSGMQARFHELGAAREAILAQSGPANAVREAIRERIGELERMAGALTAEIKRIEAPLFDIDNERGGLVRALKGKTGEAPPSKVSPMDTKAIADLITSMKIGSSVTLQVAGGPSAAPDNRVDKVLVAIDRIDADMKSLAETVKSQANGIVDASKAIAEIRRDLGAFAALIEKAES